MALTKVLAIDAGFSEMDADLLAAYDYWVDDDSATQPMTTDGAVRRRYHFASAEQLDIHRTQSLKSCEGHPGIGELQARLAGVYLHALEDSFAHRNWMRVAAHPSGVDDPWDDPQAFVLMLTAKFNALLALREECIGPTNEAQAQARFQPARDAALDWLDKEQKAGRFTRARPRWESLMPSLFGPDPQRFVDEAIGRYDAWRSVRQPREETLR